MARYIGVELLILIVGLALTVALVLLGGMSYVVFVIVPFGLAAGLYAYRFMKQREAEGRR
jgi:membrane protein implicated in regulation of membrane protease activity